MLGRSHGYGSCVQAVPSTMWYRLVAGLNAQLRTARGGSLRSSLLPVVNWLNTHANSRLCSQGVRVDLAWYQATATGYYQLGLVLNPADEVPQHMQFPDPLSPSGSPRRYGWVIPNEGLVIAVPAKVCMHWYNLP